MRRPLEKLLYFIRRVFFHRLTPPSHADSILGVSLFKDLASEDFGRFNRAFITMFRIASGDPWPVPQYCVLTYMHGCTHLIPCSFVSCHARTRERRGGDKKTATDRETERE